MTDPVFSYKITEAEAWSSFKWKVTIYIDGHKVTDHRCSTIWGARLEAKRYKKKWFKRGQERVVEEGVL